MKDLKEIMININIELENYLRHGKGNRSLAQIAILDAYKVCVDECTFDEIFEVTDLIEKAYASLLQSENVKH